MSTRLKTVAELGLIRSLSDFTEFKLPPGRLASLLNRLRKEADRILVGIHVSQQDLAAIGKRIDAFGASTGWIGQKIDIISMAAFCADLTIKREWPRIDMILVEINDFFERANSITPELYDAAVKAGESWEQVWEEVE